VRLFSSGDAIKEDDIIAQVETDKVTIDVKYTASAPGTITQLMVKEGDTVVVGQDIATVEEGVAEAKPAAPAAAAAPQPAAAAPPPPPPLAPKPAAAPEVRNSTIACSDSPVPHAELALCNVCGLQPRVVDAMYQGASGRTI
jgi:pyruvate/2-oxoglutarate dehydrogenase complex dihydrolipoamide acyltransferase (E2) component